MIAVKQPTRPDLLRKRLCEAGFTIKVLVQVKREDEMRCALSTTPRTF